ncbi:efflux RND transporter periplasmic adaptor subunit [Eggerthella sp. YY7918]|uniref:efflux RND transporter periplasmic adaptor subunit n=1 Tax=Eggerthella sp. (strain YY7918) TaxID=502558 RepID=UPI001E536B54|nr:efflux RND transporter periplasmic adaptor subunit [Eggerthella sp. YY7918]
MRPINRRHSPRANDTAPIDVEPDRVPSMDGHARGAAIPQGSSSADPVWSNDLVDAQALADMRAFNDLKAKRKKQKRKKIIITLSVLVGLVLVAGGAIAWYMADQAAKALENAAPQTSVVEKGTFTETVSASGNLQPVASVIAAPEVDGIVGEVYVSEGSAVEAGQALYTMVNADLDKAVAQAAQSVEEARNGVAQAQNAVDDAYRAKANGQQAAEQAVAGAEGGAGAGAPFDASSADSAIRQAELALNSANLTLQGAQAAYDEAVARADKRTVKAAISGSVIAVHIEPGKALGAAGGTAEAPVQIADLSQMTVSVNVNEIDILKLAADQNAEITFTAAPDLVLPAKVLSIATTSASSSDGMGPMGGAVSYPVKLLIAEPDPRLKPGMTAKATITTQTIEDALMVPISAVQDDGMGSNFILVMTDPETQETEQRAVEVLASDGLTSVIKGQVKAGDIVIADGGGGSVGMGMAPEGAVASGDMVIG